MTLEPAADANDPKCAEVMVRMPDAVAGLDRRWTDAQSTAAWGSPVAAIFRCGVEPPGPTEDECISTDGVDWVVSDLGDQNYTFTTYGREPAFQVFIDRADDEGAAQADPGSVLGRLSPLIRDAVEQTRECVARVPAG